MSLGVWLQNGWLLRYQASAQEIGELLSAADADLVDAAKGLSPGWRFAIAYNAALRLSTAALAAQGYRAARDQKHYRTIAALPLILGDEVRELAGFLDVCRAKRHDVTYEPGSAISDAEADELTTAVEELADRLMRWLKQAHHDLVP